MTKLADEIHEMNNEQLEYALREAQENLFKLRVQSTTEKLETPSRLKRLRRTIARIKTIQHQRELGIES
jgi:large subunit ribosomal protein L29